MSTTRRRFAQEFNGELCQEVISTSKPVREVAEAYGVGPETLRNWLQKYREAHGGTDSELSVPERARLKQLERENQELREETAFLKKARTVQYKGKALSPSSCHAFPACPGLSAPPFSQAGFLPPVLSTSSVLVGKIRRLQSTPGGLPCLTIDIWHNPEKLQIAEAGECQSF